MNFMFFGVTATISPASFSSAAAAPRGAAAILRMMSNARTHCDRIVIDEGYALLPGSTIQGGLTRVCSVQGGRPHKATSSFRPGVLGQKGLDLVVHRHDGVRDRQG